MSLNITARNLSRLRAFHGFAHPRKPVSTLRHAAPACQTIRYSSTRAPRNPNDDLLELEHLLDKGRTSTRYGSRAAEEQDFEHVNPLDPIAVHRAEAARRAYYSRRRNYAALGCIISILIPMVVVYNIDLEELQKKASDRTDTPSNVAREFQGKKVVVAPGGEKLQAIGEDVVELVETGTSSVPVFPKTIKLPSAPGDAGEVKADKETEYTLLGLGIRTVSFLNIQVYVVGLYVETSALPKLQAALIKQVNPIASALIPGEKEQLRNSLLDPADSNTIWESLLRNPELRANMAFRIVPTRDTNFQHLRDGMVRGITKRMQESNIAAQQAKKEPEYNDEAFGQAIKDFKALFNARGKASKGSVLLLRRDAIGGLEMFYQPAGKDENQMGPLERLGVVEDERLSRLTWLLYLGGKNVSSEPTRKNVVDGCLDLVERPIGTVETRVA
ncbi:Chalcone isomerase subgroup [Macrophomina phaseolina MS6]|uniref:Chalcone isomerase subgroup n=2 Tax=Macrophomina phaseolina TaxID=35725 RepID=K2SJY1_MACPH|nr:Chalcone isomerase subgroup [Macrophomina phaseolina MS6]KAH7049187.1 chalcone-flavanone isomerase-domain-containing protein [Macrophomina phaseolina]